MPELLLCPVVEADLNFFAVGFTPEWASFFSTPLYCTLQSRFLPGLADPNNSKVAQIAKRFQFVDLQPPLDPWEAKYSVERVELGADPFTEADG